MNLNKTMNESKIIGITIGTEFNKLPKQKDAIFPETNKNEKLKGKLLKSKEVCINSNSDILESGNCRKSTEDDPNEDCRKITR